MNLAAHLVALLVLLAALGLMAGALMLLCAPRLRWMMVPVTGRYLVEPFNDSAYEGSARFRLSLVARLAPGGKAVRVPIHPLGLGDSFAKEFDAQNARRELERREILVAHMLPNWPRWT